MLSLLPVVLGAAFAGQAATVSFSCRAEPMGRLIQDLSKATGLALSVTKPCANDVVVVDVKNVPAARLLAEIAKVDAGIWTPADGGFMFTPDRVARNEEARAERAHCSAIIQSRLSAALKSDREANDARTKQEQAARAARARERAAGLRPSSTAGFVNFDEVDDDDVTWEAGDILQVLAGIDPVRLVLSPYQKVVFSTEPNSMQSPLSPRANRVLAQLQQKHDIAAQRFITQMQAEFQKGKHPSGDVPQIALPSGSAILGDYRKADVTVETSADPTILAIGLKFYDQEGRDIFENTATLEPASEPDANPGESTGPKKNTPIKHSELSAKILELPSELADAEKFGTGFRHAADLKAAERLLLNPEDNDPLSFVVTDDLFALSEGLGKPLVAVVPDVALPNLLEENTRGDSFEDFESQLDAAESMIKVETDGWLEIKPAAPDTARKVRIDRAALGKFIRAAESKGVPSLDDVAAYAVNAPRPETEGVSVWYMCLFAQSVLAESDGEPGLWMLYRIYGQLSSDSKQELASGVKLPISALGVSQKSDLSEIIYGPTGQLGSTLMRIDGYSRGRSSGNPESEATEQFPDGIPDGGYLEMSTAEEPCFAVVDTVSEILGTYDIHDLGDIAARWGFRKVQDDGHDASGSNDEFRIGSRLTNTLRLVFAGESVMQRSLTDLRFRKDSEVFSLDNLPEGIKSLLDERVRQQSRGPVHTAPFRSGPPPNR